MFNLTAQSMRRPSGIQETTFYFLLALAAALLFPLVRDTVILRRLSRNWRFVAHGAMAVFFMTLVLLLAYGRAWRADSVDSVNLPIASVNGMGAGELTPAPRRVTLRGPMNEETAVALWWRPEGADHWSGPKPTLSNRTNWEATLDLDSGAGTHYNVLAMPSMFSPTECRNCTPLQLMVADVKAVIVSIEVNGLDATLTGNFVNPGGEYNLHLLRADSSAPATVWEDVAEPVVTGDRWSVATELRKAYDYPKKVTLRVAGWRRGGGGETVPLADRATPVPAPLLAIRKINGWETTGGACSVQPFSQVTIEGTAAHLLASERIWVRLENLHTSPDQMVLRRIAAKRIGPSEWSAEVSVASGQQFQFEATISELDPGREPAPVSSPTVRCISTALR
jgi:hypothetical protein